MRISRWIGGILAVGALAAGVFAWQRQPGAETEASVARVPAVPRPLPQAAVAEPARAQAFPAAADEPPLQAQIERLLATHDPEDAYRAYRLVADCAAFNANGDRLIFDQEEVKHYKGDSMPGFRGMNDDEKRHDARLCAGMTERERQNRLDYLAIAAKAGVMGAAASFMEEGPFGDRSALKTRPDDPLVKEWKATARAQMTRAAESGTDLGALLLWQAAYSTGSDVVDKDPALAYRYALAAGLAEADLIGPDTPLAKLYAQDSSTMTAMAAGLGPEQRAAELAAARAIVERGRAARKRVQGGAG